MDKFPVVMEDDAGNEVLVDPRRTTIPKGWPCWESDTLRVECWTHRALKELPAGNRLMLDSPCVGPGRHDLLLLAIPSSGKPLAVRVSIVIEEQVSAGI